MTTDKNNKTKNGFFAFLTSLCSRQQTPKVQKYVGKEKKKCRTHVQKKPRLTFMIDRVLVKLSRKNVAEQQFMDNQILTFNLQKYLASRLLGCDIVLISGQFSNFFSQKMAYPIYMLQKKLDFCMKQTNQILINNNKMFRMRFNVVDAAIIQLYFGQSKLQNPNKVFANSSDSKSQIDKIQKILKFYYKKINNFVFVCSKELDLQQIHSLFLVFKDHYLFEIERIKMTQKLICNIVYISSNAKFLKIDNQCLGDFLFQKLQTRIKPQLSNQGKYQNRKSIKTEQIIMEPKQDRSKVKNQMNKFNILLKTLLSKNLHIQMTTIIGDILASSQKKNDCLASFLQIMSSRSMCAKQDINQFKSQDIFFLQEQSGIRVSSEFTPMFQCQFLSQRHISDSVPFNIQMRSTSERHIELDQFHDD